MCSFWRVFTCCVRAFLGVVIVFQCTRSIMEGLYCITTSSMEGCICLLYMYLTYQWVRVCPWTLYHGGFVGVLLTSLRLSTSCSLFLDIRIPVHLLKWKVGQLAHSPITDDPTASSNSKDHSQISKRFVKIF